MVERLFGGFTMEDKKITEMFKERKEEAVGELILKYGKLFKSLARNVLGNDEDAEECVNDACMEIWNAIPPASPEHLMPFSCKIVRRVAINRLRFNLRQKRNADNTVLLSELSECISVEDGVSEIIESKRLQSVLNEFLCELDNESKALFVRRYFFFENISDLSKLFGMSENKISVRLHRIRKKLSNRLKEEGIYEK